MEFWETLKGYLTPETITVIITVVSFLVALLKLVSVVKDLKTQKALTMQNLLTLLSAQNKEEFEKEKEELLKSINSLINPLISYSQTLAKVLALSQENTPESRVAILNLIQGLGTIDVKVIEDAKKIIDAEVKTEEIKKNETLKQLEKIENKPVE